MLLYIPIIIQIFMTNTLSAQSPKWVRQCSTLRPDDTCETTITYDDQSIISIESKTVNFFMNYTEGHICQVGPEYTICKCQMKWEKCDSLDQIFDEMYITNRTDEHEFLPRVLEKLADFADSYGQYARIESSINVECDKVSKFGKGNKSERFAVEKKHFIHYKTRGNIAFEFKEPVTGNKGSHFSISIFCQLDACHDTDKKSLAYLIVAAMQQQIDSDVKFIKSDGDLETVKKQSICVMRAFQKEAFREEIMNMDRSTENEPDTFLKIERLHGIVDLLISSILVAIFVGLVVAIIVMGSISKVPIQEPLSIEHLELARSRIATCRSLMQEEARKMLTMSKLYQTINLSTIHGKDPVSEGKNAETDRE